MSKFVLITGMHRSGTSALAGILKETGLFMGNVDQKNPFNPKGNVEIPHINQINEKVLRTNGGSWMTPPFNVKWNPFLIECKNQIIQNFEKQEKFGIKDPRFCFTADQWLKTVKEYVFIASFRNPIAVARSLQHRNKFDLFIGLNLWKKYNENLLQLSLKYPIKFIEYTGVFKNDIKGYSKICKLLKLSDPIKSSFYNAKISKHSSENSAILKYDNDAYLIYSALKNKAIK